MVLHHFYTFFKKKRPYLRHMNRRDLLKLLGLSSVVLGITGKRPSKKENRSLGKPLVISTWYNQSVTANVAAWNILKNKGLAIDAVEAGVQVSENDPLNCCVGLGANPDREGHVTLDASIMNHKHEVGAVACVERIKSPIHLARQVMEKSPHVMLVGQGAQEFALQQGHPLESGELSGHAKAAYEEWLKKSEYKPIVNIEQSNPVPTPTQLKAGEFNHDTIGMLAIDEFGNLSGACTTSGMAFKMRGRVGDSPIVGAGLYVDNNVGAATATGHGEEVIRCCGSFLIVELMRNGHSPDQACKIAVERLLAMTPRNPKDIQIGFIAINKQGEYGSYSLQQGFDFGVTTAAGTQQIQAKFAVKA